MQRRWWCTIVALGVSLGTARAGGDEPGIPADAALVVRVQAAELWKSDGFAIYREVLLKAGEKAIRKFDETFSPHPSTVSDVLFCIAGDVKGRAPAMFVSVATTQPIDRDGLARQFKPARKNAVGEHTVLVGEDDTAYVLLAPKRLLIGNSAGVRWALQVKAGEASALGDAVRAASAKSLATIGFDPSRLPDAAFQGMPPPLAPIAKARMIVLASDVRDPSALSLTMRFADADSARAGEQAVRGLTQMGRQLLNIPRAEAEKKLAALTSTPDGFGGGLGALMLLGLANHADELLAQLPIARDGATVTTSAKLPSVPGLSAATAPVLVALLLPAVQKVRAAATRTQEANHFKQIGIALHSYHDVYNGFPAAAIVDKKGAPLLSWRVAILPFIEQQVLFSKFKLDEPWDSEHNKKLIPLMPQIYASPTAESAPGMTRFRVFVGPEAMFELTKPRRINEIPDGTSNTAMVVLAADPVEWTRPEGLEYRAKGPLPRLQPTGSGFQVLLADASVRMLSLKLPEATLRALITRAGGEVVDLDVGGVENIQRGPIPVPPEPQRFEPKKAQ